MRRATTLADRTNAVLRSAREPRARRMGWGVAASMSDNSLNRIPLDSATYARTHEGAQRDTADRQISPRQLPGRGQELGRAPEPVRLLLLHRRLPRTDHGAGWPQ